MRQPILLKSFIVVAALAALDGAAALGFVWSTDVQGDAPAHEPLTLTETYTHPELGFSSRYPASFRVHEVPLADGTELVVAEDPVAPGEADTHLDRLKTP